MTPVLDCPPGDVHSERRRSRSHDAIGSLQDRLQCTAVPRIHLVRLELGTGHMVAQLLQQPGGSLDVGEEEGDRAAGVVCDLAMLELKDPSLFELQFVQVSCLRASPGPGKDGTGSHPQ